MKKTVTATEARVHFGELLRGIAEEADTYVVEKAGRPTVVVISFSEYQRLMNGKPKEGWEVLLEKAQKLFQETYRGTEPPDPVELINAGRQERDDAILGDLLRRKPGVQAGDGN